MESRSLIEPALLVVENIAEDLPIYFPHTRSRKRPELGYVQISEPYGWLLTRLTSRSTPTESVFVTIADSVG